MGPRQKNQGNNGPNRWRRTLGTIDKCQFPEILTLWLWQLWKDWNTRVLVLKKDTSALGQITDEDK